MSYPFSTPVPFYPQPYVPPPAGLPYYPPPGAYYPGSPFPYYGIPQPQQLQPKKKQQEKQPQQQPMFVINSQPKAPAFGAGVPPVPTTEATDLSCSESWCYQDQTSGWSVIGWR